MQPQFEQFIRERLYLVGVAPTTVDWYRRCLHWLPSEQPTQAELKDTVLRMRQKGLKETGVNSVIRCINAYLHWASGSERRCDSGCTHMRVNKVKEPKQVMPTFTEAQMKRLIHWKPRTKHDKRLHLLVLFLLDTGCRVSEALTLRVTDVDLANMLVTLDGKGRKQRIVPFSVELRRALYRFIQDNEFISYDRVFGSSTGALWNRRNVLRNVKELCGDLGFVAPVRTLHAFRHTFALNYLRRGGSTFHLQKSLGHSTLEMTRRYANLNTDDLQAVYPRISLLRPDWRS